ncbi:MAG: hypothetical protein H7Y31_13480 [Chitinophagaceae bacterium]|nr:hypothetical protein [Chitinophagaceae bacterium]
MKSLGLTMSVAIILIGCGRDSYDPDSKLSPNEKEKIIMMIVRYVTKAPEKVKATEKFDKKYDDYYQQRTSQCKLEQYYVQGDNHFFLISQPAPSLLEKRNATGGKMKLDENGKVIEYEELFRTWKMIPDTLRRRSYHLFKKMVKGESLEPFLTKNSNGVEYIEFPDDQVFYDKNKREWATKSTEFHFSN